MTRPAFTRRSTWCRLFARLIEPPGHLGDRRPGPLVYGDVDLRPERIVEGLKEGGTEPGVGEDTSLHHRPIRSRFGVAVVGLDQATAEIGRLRFFSDTARDDLKLRSSPRPLGGPI
jgi:hypothetical protein